MWFNNKPYNKGWQDGYDKGFTKGYELGNAPCFDCPLNDETDEANEIGLQEAEQILREKNRRD